MTNTLSVAEAKAKLSEILNRVRERGERYVIQRHGKPVAAVVPVEDLPLEHRLQADDWLNAFLDLGPEAAEGGPIAAVRDGDQITIDIPNRNIHLHLPQQEIEARLKEWQPPPPRVKSGYLALYARWVESADKGAILPHRVD